MYSLYTGAFSSWAAPGLWRTDRTMGVRNVEEGIRGTTRWNGEGWRGRVIGVTIGVRGEGGREGFVGRQDSRGEARGQGAG